MTSLVSSSISEASTKLDELYHLHDTVFNMGKKAKADKINQLVTAIESCMIAAGFHKQLDILVPSATDDESTTTAGAAATTDGATANGVIADGVTTESDTAETADTTSVTESLSRADKVRAYYIFGKALDAREGYNKSSEKFLSKAVKLSPNNVDAWNALANCFWKKGDLQQAVQCFQSALEQKENPHSLRELSMLRRQLGGTNDEMVVNMSNSLVEAKKAIALDVTDKKSWYVLGNAHLAQFFQMKHDPVDLTKALKAYQRALGKGNKKKASEEDDSTTNSDDNINDTMINPDLFFNRATVHKYLENYDQAINDFKTAHLVDPELPSTNMIATIERSCLKIHKHITTSCRLKPKRLNTLANSILSSEQHQLVVRSLKAQKENNEKENESEGVSGGKSKMKTVPPVLEVTTISALQTGRNIGKIVPLKMLMPVVHETHDPPAYVAFCFALFYCLW